MGEMNVRQVWFTQIEVFSSLKVSGLISVLGGILKFLPLLHIGSKIILNYTYKYK